MSIEGYEEIFQAIETGDISKLRIEQPSYLFPDDLSSFDQDILSNAVIELHSFHLNTDSLSPLQLEAIFRKIATEAGNIKLRILKTSRQELSSVPSEVLAEALSKLDEVVIQDGSLTATQLNDIFNKIASCDNLKLKHLGINIIWESLGLTGANVRSVPPELFIESISKLEKVDFSGTDLTPAQTRAIFLFDCREKI